MKEMADMTILFFDSSGKYVIIILIVNSEERI